MLYKQYITGVLLVHYCKAINTLLHFHHYTIVVGDSITLLPQYCSAIGTLLLYYCSAIATLL